MTRSSASLHVGVDARALLCRQPRGEGKTLLRLYAEIARLRPDWRLTFFGDHQARHRSAALPPGVTVRCLTLPGHRWHSWENASLPWMALAAGCDVLHCASSGGPFWTPTPTVLTVHDLIPAVADEGVDDAFKASFLQRLGNGLRGATGVIAVSRHTRRDLLRLFPDARAPVQVVHWGASGCAAPPQSSAASMPPYVLAFGGEAPRKNIRYVLDRFIAIAPRVPAAQLVMAGVAGERERDAITAVMRSAGLAQRLQIPGFVPEAELDRLLCGARVLLYPSLYEGFGMPVLEAIERGVPVVASDLSSIPEILDGVPGCHALADVAAVERSLVGLLSDAAERDRWVREQRGVLPRFSWEQAARLTADCLAGAARRTAGQAP